LGEVSIPEYKTAFYFRLIVFYFLCNNVKFEGAEDIGIIRFEEKKEVFGKFISLSDSEVRLKVSFLE